MSEAGVARHLLFVNKVISWSSRIVLKVVGSLIANRPNVTLRRYEALTGADAHRELNFVVMVLKVTN
jgi:hypothetical protein